ncbi:hypothetical protein BGX38DRAFT_1142058 [Terfezia claveryi]|nr:hypothetical protein BGX38DRAFT_1142058 [Terfezia claveryi]
MSGRVKNLLLGKKDPTGHKHCNEDSQSKKRNKDTNEPPQTPRSPLSPGFFRQPLRDHIHSATTSHPPRTSSSTQPVSSATMVSLGGIHSSSTIAALGGIQTVPPIAPSSGRRVDTERPIFEEGKARSATHSRSSPRPGAETPPEQQTRPTPSRSSSTEGRFMNRVKASREAAQTMGGKAAKITAKATSTTAKALGEKGSKAWGKIRTKTKSTKEPQHIVPQSQYLGNFKPRKTKLPPIDVWGMSLRDATLQTRVIREMNSEADAAAYWTPAVAFRCLQYLNVHGPQELGLYRVSGSTVIVDEMKADFISRHDVDISLNPPNDIHTVTSLLKGYFRALPEAILPAEIQKKVYEQCKDHPESESPPQCFIDELSQLPPYNYYMLYSLSAHLSIVNQQSDVNKMNLSNLGMIFCSTLRIDRFCFNWLVGHWGDCWQGCWTERDELEKTDPELWKRHRDNASDMQSPAPTLDTRSSAPSSPAPSSTPHTPVPPSLLSQETLVLSSKIRHSPKLTSPQMAQSPLSIKSPPIGTAYSTPSKRAPSEKGSLLAHSAPPTPRTPVPFTPASFTMGDDQRMMIHAASDFISDYVDASDGDEEESILMNSKGKQRHKQTTDKEEDVWTSRPEVELPVVTEKYEVPAQPQKDVVTAVGPVETEREQGIPQQPNFKVEDLSLNTSSETSPTAERSKACGSRPPNIRLPHTNLDGQKPSALPGHLQLMLPPLTPMSPLIATIDHKSG